MFMTGVLCTVCGAQVYYWCDAVRQNGMLNATLSKYVVDFERFLCPRPERSAGGI